jgi:hypothetical protein
MQKILFVLCLLLAKLSWADSALPDPVLARVAADPTWLGLLQVQQGRKTGVVSFYWSDSTQSTAYEELLASWAAMQDPVQRRTLACRFPARFYFISQRLERVDAKAELLACERLVASIQLDRLEGLSLVLVGSYFSNPASTFGHTLLRIHQRSAQGVEKDLSFNYGALIPPNEHVLSYISKGIFGFYAAAYSDQDPFLHDIAYNHLENRDSWSYAIAHTPEDRLLIVLHLWEMAGAKFQYFFFSRNCAWQMQNSLMLTLRDRSGEVFPVKHWTLPVDVAHDLQDAGMVERVLYIPSHQRRLHEAIKRLAPAERVFFYQKVAQDEQVHLQSVDSQLANPPEHSPELINALIDYYTWRNASNALDAEEQRHWVRLRERAVLARLALPPDTAPAPIAPLASPAEGNKPIKWAAGVARSPWVSATVFAQGPLDPHALDIGHMEALTLKASTERGRLVLTALTLLDIQRVKPLNEASLDGLATSWRIKLGAQRHGHLKPEGVAGLGLAYRFNRWTATAYADVVAGDTGLTLHPSLDWVHRSSRTQTHIALSGQGHRQVDWQYQWSKTYFGALHYQEKPKPMWGVSVGRYW